MSDDGSHIFFHTYERITPDDTDYRRDLYVAVEQPEAPLAAEGAPPAAVTSSAPAAAAPPARVAGQARRKAAPKRVPCKKRSRRARRKASRTRCKRRASKVRRLRR
jgi:hypothetical protein